MGPHESTSTPIDTSKLVSSLLNIQKTLQAVKKNSTNPYFNSKYANLEDVLAVCKEALEAEQLLLLQPTGKDTLGWFVNTEIRNLTGEAVACRVYLTEPTDMQKLGAAITYARRYGLVSLLALEQEDDDGEGAMNRPKTVTATPSPMREQLVKLISQMDPGKAAIAKEALKQAGSNVTELNKVYARVISTLKDVK